MRTPKRTFLRWSVLCAVLIGGGMWFLLSRRIPQEPVVIYKKAKTAPKAGASEKSGLGSASDAHEFRLTENGTSTQPQDISSAAEEPAQRVESGDLSDAEAFEDRGAVSGDSEIDAAVGQSVETNSSPFGFGRFPSIPDDFPRQEVWEVFWELYDAEAPEHAKNYELINRVILQLWKEGGKASGGVLEHGKVYPLDDNTAYITWSTAESPDGEVIRYISEVTTVPEIGRRYSESHFQKGILPPGITVIEHAVGGYDPYLYVDP